MIGQPLTNGLIAGSIYALIALGFAVIYRTVRFFHFAHGVVYAAGAYAAYAMAVWLGWAIVPAFFLPSYSRPCSEWPLTASSIFRCVNAKLPA